MAWFDNTGLYQKYGTEQTVPLKGGEYSTLGANRTIDLKIDLTTLTESETILSDNIFWPKTMRIESVEVVTVTAAATGAAIDLGLIRLDRSTEIDYDGILAAFATASMNAVGEKTVLTQGSSTAGALVGAAGTSYPGYITCSRTTGTAFTAGVIQVRINLYRP